METVGSGRHQRVGRSPGEEYEAIQVSMLVWAPGSWPRAPASLGSPGDGRAFCPNEVMVGGSWEGLLTTKTNP